MARGGSLLASEWAVAIDPARPETNPEKRQLVAHDLEGAREIALLFRDNPSVLVIISPTEMVFRADWEKSK